MRENEQFSTQCHYIDLTEKTIIVRKQASNRKRQVDRLIPISSRLLPIVERLVRDAGGAGLIFTQRDLGGRSPRLARRQGSRNSAGTTSVTLRSPGW